MSRAADRWMDAERARATPADDTLARVHIFQVFEELADLCGFEGGGQGRDRTADAGLFRAALYH